MWSNANTVVQWCMMLRLLTWLSGQCNGCFTTVLSIAVAISRMVRWAIWHPEATELVKSVQTSLQDRHCVLRPASGCGLCSFTNMCEMACHGVGLFSKTTSIIISRSCTAEDGQYLAAVRNVLHTQQTMICCPSTQARSTTIDSCKLCKLVA